MQPPWIIFAKTSLAGGCMTLKRSRHLATRIPGIENCLEKWWPMVSSLKSWEYRLVDIFLLLTGSYVDGLERPQDQEEDCFASPSTSP